MCDLCIIRESRGKLRACSIQCCMTTNTFNWDSLATHLRTADWYYMFADSSPPGVRSSTIAQSLWAIAHSIDPQRAVDVWESNFPVHVRRDAIIGSGHTIANWVLAAQQCVARMRNDEREYYMLQL